MRRFKNPNSVKTWGQLNSMSKKELRELIISIDINDTNLESFTKNTLIDIANHVLSKDVQE